ncbi:hypothetical protein PHYSODRAFT_535900 [Phytophthora sojae]|uniref:Uncharacterized protein n=1 Tax=Phytophthora sojae (strain P6497) TaxID=1094619 RepID=G5AGM0_PHYSP|nr:hypothetical protein PHYSODRAFT_534397 [Phytophthora sojae]XP_009539879.1 hypothetical protein PHYSODRAFT_535900 [Phytophthora sojae]EGZ04679.1 hypothetical protein PHYSODRAFT_535900 [Phytophthora sojae]EGZ05300.1 hypothetical protein PHYSODRAFT_534397 [Phytophthora sojae]|eukprot:XP_009539221.1 hypothetical protein PHYSODRAFT_534397 [Phytophthora sojae]
MVRAIRPPRPTYMNSQVSGFYFRPCRDENDEVILEYFRCRCGTVRFVWNSGCCTLNSIQNG